MFAKLPEGSNNPNSPDFPGLNINGGLNINQNSHNLNNYNINEGMNNNNNFDYPENMPNSNLINKVSQNVGGGWLDNINCNLSFLQIYFDFETDEIIKRLIASLIPFNKNFIKLVEKNPDLYGPFWIYTTLIFIVSSAASLTKYIQGADNEDYFQKFIPLA